MIRVLLVLITITISLQTGLMADTAVKQIYLVQNSGWMLPFYEDPSSRLKVLTIEISSRIAKYGQDKQVVASFNQSFMDNQSPRLVYQGSDQGMVAQAIKSIEPVKKPGRETYADTDYKEAIVGAIKQYSAGQPCILWIITNNKNSPDNSPETVLKNREFYGFLQNTDQIRRIVAFPYRMEVTGITRKYSANGLMIYAMAYGDEADHLLQQMLKENVPFGERVARLKPLNADAVTFMPIKVRGGEGIRANIIGNNTLLLSFDAAKRPEMAQIIGQFRNDFYPYDIQASNVSISSGFNSDKYGIKSKNDVIKNMEICAGGVSPELVVTISVPPIPSAWNPDVIFKSGYTTSGKIRFEVMEQKLAISKDFIRQMMVLFPGDPLPDIFSPGESSKRSLTEQPVLIKVIYPSWPLFIVGGIMILVIGITVFAITMLRGEKIYKVSIDGIQKNYALKPFHEVDIKDANGKSAGRLKRGFGRAEIIKDKDAVSSIRLM